MHYHKSYYSLDEIREKLMNSLDPISMLKIVDAYELSSNVHQFQMRNDGTQYFHHCSRVCKILIEELYISDPVVLCAALLHDVLEDSDVLTASVIEYNFGKTVAEYVEILTKDLNSYKQNPDIVDLEHLFLLEHAPDDVLIIKLAARLDNFRCLEFNLKRNPLIYIQKTTEQFIPLAEQRNNKKLEYLVSEIKKERNKFLG